MPECKACKAWFASVMSEDLCPVCERALKRLEGYAAPVRHGWWMHSHYEDCSEHFEIVKCSNCGCEAYAMALYVRGGNYCPNCGARMDGARNGEEKD